MIPHAFARRAALCGTVVALFAVPATASAQSGGGVAPTTTATASAPSTTSTATTPAPSTPTPADPAEPALRPTATLAGAGTWRATASTVASKPVRLSGTFNRKLRGKTVRFERLVGTKWRRATTAKVRSNGRFSARWRTRSTQVHELRARVTGATTRAAAPAAGDTAGTVQIEVTGKVKATFYGPGLYGQKTACGQTLTPSTVGVAHRTLPCGTKVEIRRGGKSVVLPVIDRGPFANDATFDITKAAASDIGVDGVNAVTWIKRVDLQPAD